MNLDKIIWYKHDDNSIIACTEKIKVMAENLTEIQTILQDAYEDAILMDISPNQVLEELHKIVNSLHNPYKDHK